MSKIKFLLLLSVLATAALFSSCSDDDDKIAEIPGEISGLGNQPGELQGAKFSLPAGIELDGKITGLWSITPVGLYDNHPVAVSKNISRSETTAERIAASDYDVARGSGRYVIIFIPLKNTTNSNKELVFPARLIVRALASKYQNGVLLKETKVTIPANKQYKIALAMYCGNADKSASGTSAEYEWGVISNSPLLKELTDMLVDKKINIEEFTSANLSTYSSQVSELQSILWHITDSSYGLSDDDKAYIKALPKS